MLYILLKKRVSSKAYKHTGSSYSKGGWCHPIYSTGGWSSRPLSECEAEIDLVHFDTNPFPLLTEEHDLRNKPGGQLLPSGFAQALKSPCILNRSPLIFFKAPWIKTTFVKNRVLRKEKIESRVACKFSWWLWKCVFLWFQFSRHSPFFIFWSTLGTVLSWGKVLQ